jgi:hypothetical protein
MLPCEFISPQSHLLVAGAKLIFLTQQELSSMAESLSMLCKSSVSGRICLLVFDLMWYLCFKNYIHI